MDIHVRQHSVPGIGRLFQLPLDEGWLVSVLVDTHSDDRELAVVEPGHDEPRVSVRLREAEAVTLATLLSGARFVFHDEPLPEPVSGVHVETVVVGASSPAVGRALADIAVPDPNAVRILAVIRDDTPELLEDDARRPCQPGDRLVLVGRPGPLDEVRRSLTG